MNPKDAKSQRLKKRTLHALNEDDEDILNDDIFYKNPTKLIKTVEDQYVKEAKNDQLDKNEFFGYKIEPFHMKEERARGTINKEGFYEFNKKKEMLYRDPWLDSLEEDQKGGVYHEKKQGEELVVEQSADVIKAKSAQEKQTDQIIDFKKFSEEEINEMKKELVDMLNPRETASQALNRLRPKNQQAVKKNTKNIRKKVQESTTSEIKEPAKLQKQKEENKVQSIYFTRLIDLCDKLASTGYVDVYTDMREEINMQLSPKKQTKILKRPEQREKRSVFENKESKKEVNLDISDAKNQASKNEKIDINKAKDKLLDDLENDFNND